MKFLLVILVVILSLAFKAQTFPRSKSTLGEDSHSKTKELTDDFTIQSRIYNGESAKKGQFPYIVFLDITLNDGNRTSCGGSIIDNSWILTAAHCTHNAVSIEILYGSTKYEVGQFSHEVDADHFIQHEDYDDDSLEHDVALIRTPHVDFTDMVDKVVLADSDNDYEGYWSVASGWGTSPRTVIHQRIFSTPISRYLEMKNAG